MGITKIATKTSKYRNIKKGEYNEYIQGHQWRGSSPSRQKTGDWAKEPRPNRRGANHPNWKENVTYGNLHTWLNREYPRKNICPQCGNSPTEYCNINGVYNRERNNYIELCRSCHRKFDGARGESHKNAKLSQSQVDEIRRIWSMPTRPTQRKIAEQFGVTRGLIGAITRGECWKI